jgi:hypothetical protein
MRRQLANRALWKPFDMALTMFAWPSAKGAWRIAF